MSTPKPGDRVRVIDAGLAAIQAICERDPGFTQPPFRNDEGTVAEVVDDLVYINFDGEDGPGTGACAPYPLSDVRLRAAALKEDQQ